MKHTREATKELYKNVLAMHESGMDYKQIAKELDYNPNYISRIIVHLTGSSVTKSTQEDVEKMIELRKSGMSIKEIAKVVGFSQTTVQKQLVKAGYRTYGVLNPPHMKRPQIAYREPDEIVGVPYTMQTRKPKVYDVTIKGKKYKDVTELVGGI